jgi:plastocyanin
MRLHRLSIVSAVAMVAAIMVPQAMAAKPPQIKASFGPGLAIDIKKGKKVASTGNDGKIKVKRGAFRFVLAETSEFHNYRLVNAKGKTIKGKFGKRNRKVVTGVSATRSKPFIYTVNLKKGSYVLLCDPHLSQNMKVIITVK